MKRTGFGIWMHDYTNTYIYIFIYIYLYMYTYICTYVCIHIHTYTCESAVWPYALFICITWLIHICDMIWCDSFISVACLIHTHEMWHGWFVRVTSHSYVCHDSFICVPWLIHMCAMTHSYACHDSFTCIKRLSNVTWAICARHHDSFICVPWLIHMCDMTHSHV